MKTIKPILLNIILFQYSLITFGQSKNPLLSDIEKNQKQKIDSLIIFNTDKTNYNT
jgi:hypothetical protein